MVSIDEALFGNEFSGHLQLVITRNSGNIAIYTFYSSLQYALILLNQLCIYQSSGNGFQRWTFPFF
jgi:hypothetical protein